YFVANNQAYYKTTVIDSATTQGGPQFDPAHPVNNSPNNTGLNQLPPARGAYIWYPYAPSTDFPIVGTGGRTAEAGPVFYRDDFRNTTTASCSSTNSCGIGSWRSRWTRTATSRPSSGSCRAPISPRRSRWNSRRVAI